MGLFDTEVVQTAAVAPLCVNKALKWAIISGLVGVLGITGVLVGLHVTGSLTPDTSSAKAAAENRQTMDSFSDSIGTALIVSLDPVKDAISDSLSNMLDVLPDAVGDTKDAMSDVGEEMTDAADKLSDIEAGDDFLDIVDTLSDGVKDAVKGVDTEVLKDLGESVDIDILEMNAEIDDLLGNKDLAVKASESVKDAVEKVGEGVKEVASETLKAVGDGTKNLGDAVKEGTERLAEGVKEIAGNVVPESVDDERMRRLAWMMMTSVVGVPRSGVRASYGGNPYSAMIISRPPAHVTSSLGQQTQHSLGLLAVAGSDLLDIDLPDMEGEHELDFDLR